MNILGISCFYHDSAATIVKDGQVVAAASEERFNRRKNTSEFPIQAINFCLQKSNLTIYDIDYIAFYEKPFLKFHRVVLSHLQSYPFSFKNFMQTMPHWLKDRLVMPLVFNSEIGYEGKVLFIKHHLSHAAGSFLVSPFKEAAILTADGVGEWASMTYGYGEHNKIKILKEMRYPDSLGLFYTAITTYLGFEALEGEGKIMGLAGYGKPIYLDKLKQLVNVKEDGSFHIDQSYFGFNKGSRMFSRKFVKLFGKEREYGSELTQHYNDMAASLQKFTEDTLILIARNLYKETKKDCLCMGGGLFLNCVANEKILENTDFKEVFIQPAAGDSGGSLGAAMYVYNCLLNNPRKFVFENAYLGNEYTDSEIKKALVSKNIEFKEMTEEQMLKFISNRIAQNKIVGWFQGRMEFGPRALGCRSILASPCHPDMKDMLNNRVKHRESFRPYAPAILEEQVTQYFKAKQFSPFMLLSADVLEEKKKVIPAVTHIDGTARVQIVNKDVNPKFYKLIQAFETITGIPILINTSFNLKGEPVVCAPEDAIKDYLNTEMDCLVMGNIVLDKYRFF